MAEAALAADGMQGLNPGRVRPWLARGLMGASGFAALGCQIVWTQQSALWLGHEAAAVLAVVAAFFGGLALGAWLLGPAIDRSRRPLRWYVGCEAAIAVWCLLLALLMGPVSAWLLGLIGALPSQAWQWTVAFVGTFLLLLPATAAMGATLPAMERLLAPLQRQASSIAALYAANTLGAVMGVLAAAFWLVPQWGLTRTAALCAGLNLLCAALAAIAFSAGASGSASAATVPASATAPSPTRLKLLLLTTGLLGIGYEVLVVRVLSQVAENTVYTFALLLAVYLVGTAAGAAAWARRAPGARSAEQGVSRLLIWLALACLLGTASLWGADRVKDSVLTLAGGSMAAALGAEAVIALLAFGPPTLVMGALFSLLCTQAQAAGLSFGRALGLNTLGAAAAPLLFGVLGLPLLGAKLALLAVAAGYLLLSLSVALSLSTPKLRNARTAWAGLAAVGALALWAPPLQFINVPEGGRLISLQQGARASVSVVEDGAGVARLHIDNRQQEGSSATRLADARQALLPLLLHPAPRRALFLGLGTGVTASSAAQDASLQVDAVELLPEVVQASAHFTQAIRAESPQTRLRTVVADARRYVRAQGPAYDLIVSDNFHPARSGSAALYTVEHFTAVRQRLASGGLFCQWLPLHQLDLATLRSIVATFTSVYPGAFAVLATHSLETPVLGLVARQDDGRFALQPLRDRLASVALPHSPADFGLHDEWALLGSFVAGPRALQRFAGTAPLNTDDRPLVAYLAPRITYAPDSLPRDRLLALLAELSIDPAELLLPAAGGGAPAASRLAAYWQARNLFLRAGRAVQPTSDVRQMLAQVQEPLLAVLRTSPDFRPAYDPLLRMATALSPRDPTAARDLLRQLQQAQPARAEAGLVLRDLQALAP